MARDAFICDAAALIAVPPSLPHPQPTAAAWQQPPHPSVSGAQSPALPQKTDVVVIGSGISGISVARSLLHATRSKGQPLRVTMLEARTAVSGATGRNGGHLVSGSEDMFPHLAETAGFEQALEVARFSEANIRHLRELAHHLPFADREAAELRILDSATAYEDQDDLDEAAQASKALNQKLPDSTIEYQYYSSRNASEELGFVPSVAGAIQQNRVAALWPYRLLTAVLAEMLTDFAGRFTIETHTPVLSIDHDPGDERDYPYIVRTSRGSVRARHIVHCTNGHAATLIPGLVGKLYPLRGTMSTQRLGPSFPRVGDKLSWSYMTPATYDPHSGQAALGLYYAQQSARTGIMFVGGESQSLQGLLSSDDSVVGEDARRTLIAAPARIWRDAAPTEPLQVWSGIMGFTGDGLPLVGNLGQELTGRQGTGEWIAAGYNGHGMDKAWLCGHEVARMVLGEEDDEGSSSLPGLFRLTDARVSSWTPTAAAETLANHVMMREENVLEKSKS